MLKSIVDAFPYRIKRHVLNTAGIIRHPEYQYDMVRLGIGLYGVPVLNDGSEAPLRQVSTLRTPIISIKEWDAGTTIGYGRRGVLTRRSIIATIPIGYADGINRRMGCGRVKFLVNGVECPTVGSICMDICMIDVTDVPSVAGRFRRDFRGKQPRLQPLRANRHHTLRNPHLCIPARAAPLLQRVTFEQPDETCQPEYKYYYPHHNLPCRHTYLVRT